MVCRHAGDFFQIHSYPKVPTANNLSIHQPASLFLSLSLPIFILPWIPGEPCVAHARGRRFSIPRVPTSRGNESALCTLLTSSSSLSFSPDLIKIPVLGAEPKQQAREKKGLQILNAQVEVLREEDRRKKKGERLRKSEEK